MATAYRDYQPLEECEQQIRVLTVHAAEASRSDDLEPVIKCSLENVALRHANPFYALSYVWGPSTPTGSISVNGQTVCVRRNLWLFLLTMRERFCGKASHGSSSQGSSIRIWADYVCIRQNSIRERNSQVSMMGDIYKTANAIYAWLGESTMPVDDGMRCIAETAALRKQHVSWNQIRREVGSIDIRVQNISASHYWSRMWIKQEALLAKDLWFFYGQDVVHWQDMLFAIKLCPPLQNRQSQFTSFRAMLSLLQARERQMAQFELHDLVERFADAGCEDPRDRIYALLALIDHKTSQQIIVDYQKPALQVVLDNYRHLTTDGVAKHIKNDVDLDNMVYHLGHFCTVIYKILPQVHFEAIYSSMEARRELTAHAAFAASDVSSVEWVCPIASISGTTIEPVSYIHETEKEKTAFVLRISLRPYSSKHGARSRQCFLYSDIVPNVDNIIVWLGSRALFVQLSEDAAEDLAERVTHLVLVGTGTEIREISTTTGGDKRLSRQLLLHPCLWPEEQLDDARFAIHTPRSRQNYNKVSVICNAAAIILLLHEFRRDQEASAQDKHDGSFYSAVGTEGVQPRRWSPYTFGVENKLLQPCQLCKSTGRSAALAKRPTSSAVARLLCECTWISRTEC